MKFTALLSQYSIIGVLGLGSSPNENQQQIIAMSANAVIQNAITTAHSKELITQQKLEELEQIKDPQQLQEKLMQIAPNINEIIAEEAIKLKVDTLKAQVNDFKNFAKSKVSKPENLERINTTCNRLLQIIESDEISEADDKALEEYHKLKELFKFNQ